MHPAKTLALAAGLSLATTAAFAQNVWTGTSVPTTTSGNVGIGTTSPSAKLHVIGGINVNPPENTDRTLFVGYNTSGEYSYLSSWDWQTLSWRNLVLNGGGGNVGINTLSPGRTLDVAGTTRTEVLEITGGSDLAEGFRIASPVPLTPGMVVSIDPDRPGQLRLAGEPYDRTVAGILSGAGGVDPGLVMGQNGSIAAGEHLVALTGRAYVLADASNGPIRPGDLLTTSDRPGYAMKAADSGRTQGAVLGKAMTALDSGQGEVLVLVSLQ